MHQYNLNIYYHHKKRKFNIFITNKSDFYD